MSRISIDVSPEEHRMLKALAAIQGKTIKDYLLEGKIGVEASGQDNALAELEALLDQRIKHHRESGQKGRPSANAILQDVLKRP
jgi:hypothetical protein